MPVADLSAQQRDFLAKYLVAPPAGPPPDAAGPADGATRAGDAAASIPEGTVSKRSFMVERWTKVPAELKLGVDALASAVPEIVPWEDAAEISALVRTHLDGLVDRMQADIASAFDDDVSAGDGSYKATRDTISDLRDLLRGEPLLAELRKGIVVPGALFVDAFETALNEIDATLGS